ncbi:MAG: thermonuclease family protein, partial [Acidimicrobiia bacterium]
ARSTRPKTGPARKAPTGKAAEPPGERLWVQANDGVCPPSHPVKAKLSSKIFHPPGARNYNRTQADRCYPDEASAQADGLRPALR